MNMTLIKMFQKMQPICRL